ncbi:uncharacterized protein YcfL [Paenibacillus eucommiae]|uniref:Uncharacterized protein YcfL n=1 Tax=Paenibacillus eucommiae TaxID=1355755 RepID=A0ABS4IP49_9BACL|nr:uncharacterized protein YcfL [Paenibacillus eucommiae]
MKKTVVTVSLVLGLLLVSGCSSKTENNVPLESTLPTSPIPTAVESISPGQARMVA